MCPDSQLVDGYVNVEVRSCEREVGANVDAQSVQEIFLELTAVCESWWEEAWATVLNECALPSTQNLDQNRRACVHTDTTLARNFLKNPSIRRKKKKVFGVNQNYKRCSQWWVILGWVRASYKGKSAIKEAGKPALVWLFQHKEDKSSVPTLHVHQSRKTLNDLISQEIWVWKGKQHLPNANRINKEDEQTRAGTHQHVMLFTVHQLTVKRVNWNDNYNYNMSLLEYIQYTTIFTRP